MPSPFDDPQYLANPAVQELLVLLASNFWDGDEIRQIALKAGLLVDRIASFRRAPSIVWVDVLDAARNQESIDPLMAQLKAARGAALKKRLEELASGKGALEAKPSPVLPGDWQGGNQRLLADKTTLLDVDFLEAGVRVARAVCKLDVETPDGEVSYATGFLIEDRKLLSNHHALFARADAGWVAARSVSATFLYQRGTDKSVSVQGDVNTIYGNKDFDWAVIDLCEAPPADCQALRLGSERAAKVGDPVFIVQHPGGGPKKVGLYRNEVRYLNESVLQYLTDTEAGSSGSPVLNDRWEVIALHHRWIKVDGPGGERRNQGVHIQRVLDGLRLMGFTGGVG